MPVIQRSWQEMWTQDIVPFRALKAKLPMIMVAHAAYPRASGSTIPASVSPFWITEVLRRKLRYSGLVISDDMEMGGILTQRSMDDAAVEAIAAGADVLEICRNPALILMAYEALLSEAEGSPSFRRRVEQIVGRIIRCKARLTLAEVPRTPPPRRLESLRQQVRELLH
jgi:beta-N-acetylhexosaminidase